MSKVVAMSIGEFMSGKEPYRVRHFDKLVVLPLAASPFYATKASAAGSPAPYQKCGESSMTATTNDASGPIFDLMRAAGLPAAGIALGIAAFMFMATKEHKAWQFMKGAGLGYIILNLIPLALNMFTAIGDQICNQ